MTLFAIPFPALNPVLVEIGPLSIRWYALAYIAGIFFGWWYAKRLAADAALWGARGAPMRPADFDDFVIWGTLGVVLGGRLGYVLAYNLPVYAEHPLAILAVWDGGMSFHGGFLGVVIATLLFARSRNIPAWSFIDVLACAVPVGLFLGRIANFINAELWGNVTSVPWGVVFPGQAEPRHPSQLYEAALEGIALFLLLRLLSHGQRRLRQPAFISGAFAAWYGTSRILVEFFRQPDEQIGYLMGPLTMGMLLSLPMALAGIGLMLWAGRRAS